MQEQRGLVAGRRFVEAPRTQADLNVEGWGVSSKAAELTRKLSWIERVYSPTINPRPGTLAQASVSIGALPSFFVIGPPRTGTTWLYDVLRDRAVLPTPTKETRFFDTHFHRGLAWYRAHFPSSSGNRPMGEIAPTYFASTEASTRIARTVPEAKVVCVFRNPVERVLSLYKLKKAYGLIPWSLEQALVRDPEMLESSRYATRLKLWQCALGRNQVQATIYDDLRDCPQSFLDTLVDFVGIPRFQLTESQLRCVHSSETMTHPRNYHRTRSASTMADWFKARRLDKVVAAVRNSPLRTFFLGGGPPFADVPAEVLRGLYDMFREEVQELENMLNRDLSGWKALRGQSFSIPSASL